MTSRVKSSGVTIAEALQVVATELSLTINELDYEVTREQFFAEDGTRLGVDIVEIEAWIKEKIDTSGIEAARDWLQKLLDLMNIEAKVSFVVQKNNRSELRVLSEQGGRVVGRKGSTLRAIRAVMKRVMDSQENAWEFSIEVDGGEKSRDSRRRDHGDRRDYGDRRDRKPRTSRRDQDKLKQLAKRLAQKVLSSQEVLVINRELSSFERRIVHLTIQDMNGVGTESFMDGDVKRIRIVLEATVEE